MSKNNQLAQLQIQRQVRQHTTQKCQLTIKLPLTDALHRKSSDLHTQVRVIIVNKKIDYLKTYIIKTKLKNNKNNK